MEFEEWEPYYIEILRDFSYSREEDERSARLLDQVLAGDRISLDTLRHRIEGKEVFVAGNAPSLKRGLTSIRGSVIAADEAASVLIDAEVLPDIIVTDLDGRIQDQVRANSEGSVAVIHAHGDNMPAVKKWAPLFDGEVVGTTQSRPFGRIFNFGGFTDGDRAVFLARHFGASSVRLVGFDFEHPSPKDENPATKLRKLAWAKRLIGLLGLP